MIIYVESNFILEIALGQEQSSAAEKILKLGERKKIKIVCPSFSISEPFSTVTGRGRNRKKVISSFSQELKQLIRSAPHKKVIAVLEKVPFILADLEKIEVDRLEKIANRMLKVSVQIELNSKIFKNAMNYEKKYSLSPQDAIILSSIMSDLKKRSMKIKKIFISLNKEDFDDPGIQKALKRYNCQYNAGFDETLKLVK